MVKWIDFRGLTVIELGDIMLLCSFKYTLFSEFFPMSGVFYTTGHMDKFTKCPTFLDEFLLVECTSKNSPGSVRAVPIPFSSLTQFDNKIFLLYTFFVTAIFGPFSIFYNFSSVFFSSFRSC